MKRADGASSYAVYLRFQASSYAYYVYEASARGPNEPTTGASTRVEPMGVVIERRGQPIRRLSCKNDEGFSYLSVSDLAASIAATQLPEAEGADPGEIAFPREP